MKKIIVPKNQSIAWLLCSGLIPAFDLGSDYGDECRRLLVVGDDYANGSVKLTAEWSDLASFAASVGIIPEQIGTHYSGKVIGTLDVVRKPHFWRTYWSYNSQDPATVYEIVNARLLDVPTELELVLASPNKLQFSHRPMLVSVDGETLVMPLTPFRFECNCYSGNTLTFTVCDYLREFLFNDGELVQYKYIKFISNNRSRTFVIERVEFYEPQNEVGQRYLRYSGILNTNIPLEVVIFTLGEQV